VIQLWHAVDGRLYLDGQARGKFSIVKLKDIVMKALEDYKPKFVVIEHASVGPALYSMLYKELGHERAYGLLQGWTPRGGLLPEKWSII
jgi:phage terminase large subunit-like protein